MLVVIVSCAILIACTTLIHYEVLRALTARLPRLEIPNRTKLLVVVFATFAAHTIEISLYGAVLFVLIEYLDAGSLNGPAGSLLARCFYFSAETYTSLGFGDMTPVGSLRLVAGTEALNGLLLIGWSASYLYLAMEKFWSTTGDPR